MSEDALDSFDLFVIGSGPAGQRAAIQAAKLGKRVGIAEQQASLGGVCINTGTIPSKTFREAVVQLRGGPASEERQKLTMSDLLRRVRAVVDTEGEVAADQLRRNGVEIHWARAVFEGPHTLRLDRPDGRASHRIHADHVAIATGTTATKDPHIPFDGDRVFSSDDVLALERVPRTLTVVGAGIIGAEYASIFAELGVRVTLIDKRRELLPFIDSEIAAALTYELRRKRVTLRLGEEVQGIEVTRDANGSSGGNGGNGGNGAGRVRIKLASGKQVASEQALYSVGRTGVTAGLNLDAAGLFADDRGRLEVNEHYQTAVPHIYAVGDVVGFPALAATAMEQGRLAAAHAFGLEAQSMPALLPYGIYTVPQISTVGRSEQELTEAGIPYEVGTAQYREIARGQILGDLNGMLKLIFHLETRELLAVHIIGEGATELVHIGQAVMAFGGGADHFLNTVFNYPTLAECYKTAALDATNRMRDLDGVEWPEAEAA
jgi:NAD(P) transhydrogenase